MLSGINFPRALSTSYKESRSYIRKFHSSLNKQSSIPETSVVVHKNDALEVPNISTSVLEASNEQEQSISSIAPYLQPSFNFAAYVNKSKTLQELLKLGVNLYKLEKKVTVPQFLLALDFERDVQQHVLFLHDLGVSSGDIANIITKNPYIFKPTIENLQVRVNYLQSKSFTGEMICRIMSRNPFWLMFPTPKMNTRLGYFQKEFKLSGSEVRKVATKQPKLITYKLHDVKVNQFSLKEEMGFSAEQCKDILLNKPIIYMKDQMKLVETFAYLHQTANISNEIITKIPGVLTCRLPRLKQRHSFLKHINKEQFNPREPNYISILDVVSGTDVEFCEKHAQVPIELYNNYLKTL